MRFLTILFLALLSLTFTFCSEEEEPAPTAEDQLTGIWERVSIRQINMNLAGDTTLDLEGDEANSFTLLKEETSNNFPEYELTQIIWWKATDDTIYNWEINDYKMSSELLESDVSEKQPYIFVSDTLVFNSGIIPDYDNSGEQIGSHVTIDSYLKK